MKKECKKYKERINKGKFIRKEKNSWNKQPNKNTQINR